ncbi:MAG: DEAD/DEAH box helicase family protein [Rhodobacteraceae bacterium]|nr:DEAD/DEAH box helicase family protein [Paracoccaceae bacterium]
MQDEVVMNSVALLQEHAAKSHEGRARGRIILPCGTGKSRIALRIIEELTPSGQVSVVLCPSIALVAQLRSEFLAHRTRPMKVLAVCSDQGVERERDLKADPTADLSQMSATEVKGTVTTDDEVIGQWIDGVMAQDANIGVIFGTYQSSHRIADALGGTRRISVLIADEAHRTAGLRRQVNLEDKIKDFTVCHYDQRFPAKFRVYQTATPRVYGDNIKRGLRQNEDWIVRDMADESVFGVELARKSYAEAVENGWLTDYKIIAIGVQDETAYKTANALAANSKKLSTAQFMRGLVLSLVMGGALRKNGVQVRSSINFMNMIAKSKEMVEALNSQLVHNWVRQRLEEQDDKPEFAAYQLEHLDASNKVAERENAKGRLMAATDNKPHGIINVGIFGEGVDAPNLSAVGFLEARKSPVDVIQAVGRVMRRAEDKELGYIICPILIPPNVDAETWLQNSGPEDGWQELGQILLALRAHDARIEDNLSDLMEMYLPPAPLVDVATLIAFGGEDKRTQYHGHVGKPGTAERDAAKVLEGRIKTSDVFVPVRDILPSATDDGAMSLPTSGSTAETIVSGKQRADGSLELRKSVIVRDKAASDGTPGPVNPDKSKKKARNMLNGKEGLKVDPNNRKKKREEEKLAWQRSLLDDVDNIEISANLLRKSGLARNRAERDANILEDSIREAKRCLVGDELNALLDRHFGVDKLDHKSGAASKIQADGCTIAALILMNAAMLHQRIAAGGWLPGIDGMDSIKNAPEAVDKFHSQWNRITRHDFLPVIEPAIEVIEVVRDAGRRAGLNRALRHLAGEAERIAEHYADLGTDHAGALFNKVMGNQASDGAFFTRPPAATLLARLTLDATDSKADWTDIKIWDAHRSVDLACGSGTLLAALLTEMKRRAQDHGASDLELARFQRHAVESVVVGLDMNPVSLQLAAAQLTAGNQSVTYKKMQLHRMPYGPVKGGGVKAGSLELLSQPSIVPSGPSGRFDFGDEQLKNTQLQLTDDDPLLEDAISAACNVRIVVMNPPFTNRSKMGEKFHKDDQRALRKQVDELEQRLVAADPDLKDFVDKNALGPLFVAMADRCLNTNDGVLAMVRPTIALTGTSGIRERRLLAKRFHVHTLLTSHQPGQVNLSQHTAINESMIILRRCKGNKPPTRIINLDRMPLDEGEAATLHQVLQNTTNSGLLSDGWGEVSEWPEERIAQGDWSAAVFRSPVLAEAAYEIAHNGRLRSIKSQAIIPSAVLGGGAQMRPLRKSTADTPGSFPVLYSKSEDAQKTICARPDRYLISTKDARDAGAYGEVENTATQKLLRHAGYLLVTAGQDTSTARLSAVANEASYLGSGGWHPVPGLGAKQAKALAVFLNSTAGRIQLLGNSGKKLSFPKYNPGAYEDIRVPDLDDESTITKLATCWEHTFDMVVPQYRDGECEVRQLWDYAVAEALGWDRVWLDDLRQQLHDEPHVRGLGRDQYGDSESGIIKTNFQTLIHPTLPHGDTTHSMAGPNVQTTRRATSTCPVNSTRNHNL